MAKKAMTKALIADIGGTNARFALVDEKGIYDHRVFKVADYDGPAEAAQAYLSGITGAKPEVGAFAVAGPAPRDDIFKMTNHKWSFSVSGTRDALSLKRLSLINDFHAMALGVLQIKPDNMLQIGQGTVAPQMNKAVIGPGTGLGVASLVWDERGKYYVVVPSEASHGTLPVKTDREWAVVKQLQEKFGHVSADRVCSGKGLVNLYQAICAVDGREPEQLEAQDISIRAVAKSCPSCVETLDMMLGFLGRVTGNLALASDAHGGVYLCGGVLPKLGLEVVAGSRLRTEFASKGRLSPYLDAIPTFIVTDEFLPLKGLQVHALRA